MSKSPKKQNIVKEQQESYMDERYEIIEGIRYDFKPSPASDHQLLVTEMNASLRMSCHDDALLLVAPMDVYLDDDNTVQPDLIYVKRERAHIITRRRVNGAPDLVVEIMSPSTGSRDKKQKKALYARFGIREYWIVDPFSRTVDQFILEESDYRLAAVYAAGDCLESPHFPSISIDITSLFAPLALFDDEE